MTEQQLPNDISYQKLYEPEQNIWLLNWILKQHGCYSYLNQIILSMPFTVKRVYHTNGKNLKIFKNSQQNGLERGWYSNGQLYFEFRWKNGVAHGMDRGWYNTGQLNWEENWQNGQRHGFYRGWFSTGKLYWEHNWQNGIKISDKFY